MWDLEDEEVHACIHGLLEIETAHVRVRALADRKMHTQVLGDEEVYVCRHTCQHKNDNKKPLLSKEEL